jgi:hypothetical protein
MITTENTIDFPSSIVGILEWAKEDPSLVILAHHAAKQDFCGRAYCRCIQDRAEVVSKIEIFHTNSWRSYAMCPAAVAAEFEAMYTHMEPQVVVEYCPNSGYPGNVWRLYSLNYRLWAYSEWCLFPREKSVEKFVDMEEVEPYSGFYKMPDGSTSDTIWATPGTLRFVKQAALWSLVDGDRQLSNYQFRPLPIAVADTSPNTIYGIWDGVEEVEEVDEEDE